jgi:hypothetical protein
MANNLKHIFVYGHSTQAELKIEQNKITFTPTFKRDAWNQKYTRNQKSFRSVAPRLTMR